MPNRAPLQHPRVTLPKNLSEALKRLQDAEIEKLLREVIVEAERHGLGASVHRQMAPPTVTTYKFPARQAKAADALGGLPAAKINLIKASHSAGMKPQAIARMFRVSQLVVNTVLDRPAKPKK